MLHEGSWDEIGGGERRGVGGGGFFFFNDTATTEIYTLSLHDALPISPAYQTQGWSGVQNGEATGGYADV